MSPHSWEVRVPCALLPGLLLGLLLPSTRAGSWLRQAYEYGEEGVSCQSLHLLSAKALGAESGLGLLRGQDSGCIQGRLNLLGNGENVDCDKLFASLYELVQFTKLSQN